MLKVVVVDMAKTELAHTIVAERNHFPSKHNILLNPGPESPIGNCSE